MFNESLTLPLPQELRDMIQNMIDRTNHKYRMGHILTTFREDWTRTVYDWYGDFLCREQQGGDVWGRYDPTISGPPNLSCLFLDHRLGWLRWRKPTCNTHCYICRGSLGPYQE